MACLSNSAIPFLQITIDSEKEIAEGLRKLKLNDMFDVEDLMIKKTTSKSDKESFEGKKMKTKIQEIVRVRNILAHHPSKIIDVEEF